MIVIPHLVIDGMDVSRYFLSAHCEMTANGAKDPGKYDLVLSNVGGVFTGMFAPKPYEELTQEGLQEKLVNFKLAPKKKVSLRITTQKQGCEGSTSRTQTIFSGEIQKAEADEKFCKIEGSCSEGGMTSKLRITKTWKKEEDYVKITNDILDMFGGIPAEKRHIMPAITTHPDVEYILNDVIDFDVALYKVSWDSASIYFFDENDDFWLVPAYDFKGMVDLTGNILLGSNASTMVGYCNHIDVYGGSLNDISERKTHNLIYAYADTNDNPESAWETGQYGVVKAPPVYVPNADYNKCKEIADNLLNWYRQYRDVPQVKVVGKAPGLLSKVLFTPWNNNMPPIRCDEDDNAVDMGPVIGLVTRRVVDISASTGFVCTLDITTNFKDAGVPMGDSENTNFYSNNRAAIDADPAIVNKYPGVVFV